MLLERKLFYNNEFTLKSFISFFTVLLLLLNNILYQTEFQINQIVLCFALILFFLVLGVTSLKISVWLVINAVFLISVYFSSLFFSESKEDLNRILLYFAIFGLFLLVYFYGYALHFSKIWLPIFIFLYACISVMIIVTGDRGIVNPNWVAMTMFYVYFLVAGKSKVKFLLVGFVFSYFIFESRGTSVVFLVSIMIFYSQKILGEKVTKIGYLISYYVLVFSLFYIIHSLAHQGQNVIEILNSVSERGLSGREIALIPAYLDLLDSWLLGAGPASSGSYTNSISNGSVHIHFGLLELMLKFSIAAFFVFSIILLKLVKKSSVQDFPLVGGAMMSVFFYNGLAPSHLGLNVFLILIISRILKSPKQSGQHKFIINN